jgi:hypothetical protein
MKLQHKHNKVLFAPLERTLNDDFFKGKIGMNLCKDLPSDEFNKVLEHRISRSIDRNPQMGHVHLESHYRVDPLLELDNLKDIVDGSSRNVNFLNHKSKRTFVVFLTTNSLNKEPNVYFPTDWKSVLSSLLSMKVGIKIIVCICNQTLIQSEV